MKNCLRLLATLVLAALAFSLSVGAITILGQSTSDKVIMTEWREVGTIGFTVVLDEPVDVSGMENLYLRIYVDNPDNCYATNNGQLELTSAGTCDVEESNINPFTLDWQAGWNEFAIPLDEFAGDCDMTRVNYVRLYMFTDGMNCSILDYVAVGNSSDDMSVLVKNDWPLSEKPDPNAKKPDIVNLEAKGKGSPWTAVLDNAWGDPMDISQYDSAYIGLYVSNIDKYAPHLGGGQIEFGSAYIPDAEEDSVNINNLPLESGWNYFEIPLYTIYSGCDYTQFDHFRIYMFFDSPDEEIEVKLDYVAFGPEGMEVGEGLANTFPFVLIKPLAEREAEAATAAEAQANADDAGAAESTTAPQTSDFSFAVSATLLAATAVTIVALRKRKK